VSTRRSFFQLASLKRFSSAAADRYALPVFLPLFALVVWADRYFPGDISFAPFYCVLIALLAWYRSATMAYLAAVLSVLAVMHNAPAYAVEPANAPYLALRLLPDLVLFGGFAFVTLQARSHYNRLKVSVDALERLAFRDPLTGLPNRPLLYDRLAIAISQARRNHAKVALLILDLDSFKIINDRHGHQAGDEVLKTVAHRLTECVRGGDTVARLGGDEYAIVLSEINDPHDAENVADKVLASVAEPMAARAGGPYQIGVSIGISLFPDHGNEIDKLLSCADAAMYRSKHNGKNIYTFFGEPEARNTESLWIAYNRSLETGYAEIDQQHRQLIALANKLNASISDGQTTEIIKRQFDELLLYTRFHFSTEERLMAQLAYPHQEEHKLSHQRLLEDLGHIMARLRQGSELIALQTIKDWLLGHIENADKPLGAHLHQLEQS
jgi:diguanylate cyclase (GGDEF)-like protein/hemerythrin-like metal-binding protein